MTEFGAGTAGLILEETAFCGRTLAEYQKIFDLDLSAWKGKAVLDCPAGASSFTAEAERMGVSAVGCDPQFGADVKELVARGRNGLERMIEQVRQQAGAYNWTFYPSIPAIREYRLAALDRFARDYPVGLTQGRYVKGALPDLPFGDRRFDLVLSGYFLFMYGDRYDYDFHLAAVMDLYRVCDGEVRIYPVCGSEGTGYPQMERLLVDLIRQGIPAEIVPVSFEFQRGCNQLLRLVRQ